MLKLEKLFNTAKKLTEEEWAEADLLVEEIYSQLKRNRRYLEFYCKAKNSDDYYCLYDLSGQEVGVHYYMNLSEVGYGSYKNTKYDHYADELLGKIAVNAKYLEIVY